MSGEAGSNLPPSTPTLKNIFDTLQHESSDETGRVLPSLLRHPPPPPPARSIGAIMTNENRRGSIMSSGHRRSSIGDAIESLDFGKLVQLLKDEVSAVPPKARKQVCNSTKHVPDQEFLKFVFAKCEELLNHSFLTVDLSSPARDVKNSDWSTVSGIRRSDAGTTGIYFIQCTKGAVKRASVNAKLDPAVDLEVIVAKPMDKEEFDRHVFVNALATEFFKLDSPAIRFLQKSDAEFDQLETAVKNLFEPLNRDMYEQSGTLSPKNLFQSHAICLMEIVKGRPLCHKAEGQRELFDQDFRAIGRLFLFDLLIHNTDRLPCRKAMDRQGNPPLYDCGNAGNLMFGPVPGSLWSIDPEMQTRWSPEIEATYVDNVVSVVEEIIMKQSSNQDYQAIISLFCKPLPGLEGILDSSLDDLKRWDKLNEMQKNAVSSILDLIRIRAKANNGHIVHAKGPPPPAEYEGNFDTISITDPDYIAKCEDIYWKKKEADWRKWINKVVPRASSDVMEFIRIHTGLDIHSASSVKAFELGFLESMSAAIKLRKSVSHIAANPLRALCYKPKLSMILLKKSLDIDRIMRLVERLEKAFISISSKFPPAPHYSACGLAVGHSVSAIRIRKSLQGKTEMETSNNAAEIIQRGWRSGLGGTLLVMRMSEMLMQPAHRPSISGGSIY